jgi:hypothetical protein
MKLLEEENCPEPPRLQIGEEQRTNPIRCSSLKIQFPRLA